MFPIKKQKFYTTHIGMQYFDDFLYRKNSTALTKLLLKNEINHYFLGQEDHPNY